MSRFLTPIVANLDPDYRFSSKFIIIGDREGGVAVNSRDKKHGTDQNGSDKTGSDVGDDNGCLLYTSPSPRDRQKSRMPSSA